MTAKKKSHRLEHLENVIKWSKDNGCTEVSIFFRKEKESAQDIVQLKLDMELLGCAFLKRVSGDIMPGAATYMFSFPSI